MMLEQLEAVLSEEIELCRKGNAVSFSFLIWHLISLSVSKVLQELVFLESILVMCWP